MPAIAQLRDAADWIAPATTEETQTPRKSYVDEKVVANLKKFSLYSGAFTTVAGLMVCAAWLIRIQFKQSFEIPFVPCTGFGFILCGLALLLDQPERQSWWRRIAIAFCSSTVFAVALWLVTFYIMCGVAGKSEFLSAIGGGTSPVFAPSHTAPNSAFIFVVTSAALLFVTRTSHCWARWSQYLSAFGLLCSLMAITGYSYNVTALYALQGLEECINMPLQTAICFAILSLGVLSLRPEQGIFNILVRDSVGGAMSRRLFPSAVAIPLVLGWLRHETVKWGFIDSTVGLILVVALMIIVFAVLIWWNSMMLDRMESARRLADEALRAAQERRLLDLADHAIESARFKSDFLAKMSHEIRTPLNAVIGVSELLKDTPLNSEQHRYLQLISSSGESLLAVINDILCLSKIEAGGLTLESIPFDFVELIESAIDSLAGIAQHKKISLSSFIAPDLNTMRMGDPARIRQILLNLLSNSIKFTESGEVSLIAFSDPERADGQCIRFCIVDTGIGMAKESIDRLFAPFMQADESISRRFGGTGLGLSICKRLTELMAGRIQVCSELGSGTAFSLSLPLPIADSPTTHVDLPLDRLEDKKVLIVGPESWTLDSVIGYMRSWRVPVSRCATAEEGLNELMQQLWNGTPYTDAILSLPVCDKEVYKLFALTAKHPELASVRIIVVTPSKVKDKKLKALKSGRLTTIQCPCRQLELANCIARNGDAVTRLGTSHSDLSPVRASTKVTNLSDHDVPNQINEMTKILLVEDNPVNRHLAGIQLKQLQLKPDTATNGEEAVEAVGKHDYDLVLMDCQMPIMDGFTAVKQIRLNELREHKKRTIVVAMTANAVEGDREMCIAAGMDDYLAKPVTQKALNTMIEKWLGERVCTKAS